MHARRVLAIRSVVAVPSEFELTFAPDAVASAAPKPKPKQKQPKGKIDVRPEYGEIIFQVFEFFDIYQKKKK